MSVIKLHFKVNKVSGLTGRVLGRIVFNAVPHEERKDCFFALLKNDPSLQQDLEGYAAILTGSEPVTSLLEDCKLPLVTGINNLDQFTENTILAINAENGSTHILYRPESTHNALFATARCNSNCLMCSQPPTLADDNHIVEEHLRLIKLIKNPPQVMGITGGEPTLLGNGLIRIVSQLKDSFPDTYVHMLTNGRLYAYEDLVKEIAAVEHPAFLSAIPLYSDIATEHDYIVQAKGAFDETLQGLYNTAKYQLSTEIRVVLHKQTIPRLVKLMEFIYRNLPFVDHVALMGLENMGYVKKNWELLWIDPVDYADELYNAVKHLFYRGIQVSIYNLPLCVVPKSIWEFAKASISDYKNIYLNECNECEVKEYCSGLFASSQNRHSSGIHPVKMKASEINNLLNNECAS